MKCSYLIFALFLFQIAFAQADIFDVSRKGTVDEVKAIMKQNPDAINSVNEEGYSPLILACYRGNIDVAKFLIKEVNDINGNSSMGTPLMAAVVKGNKQIVQVLLENKADPNLTDANGTTALMYAVQFNNSAIVKVLIDFKADKSKIDVKGKTAFEYAAFSNNEEIINLLK